MYQALHWECPLMWGKLKVHHTCEHNGEGKAAGPNIETVIRPTAIEKEEGVYAFMGMINF